MKEVTKPVFNKVKLTKRQFRFIELWLDPTNKKTYANTYKAALEAGFSPSYSKIITADALNLEWVKEAKKRLAAYEPEHIYRGFQDIAAHGAQDRDRLKALELMGKARGMFVDRVQQDVQIKFVNDVPRPDTEIIEVEPLKEPDAWRPCARLLGLPPSD